jgi:hypothetical protein
MTALQVTPGAGQTVFCLPYIPLGYQQYTSLSAATVLSGIPAGATAALIMCEVASIRYRDDGTNPTAAIGMLMGPGGSPLLYAGTLAALAFIQVTAGAVLDVLYYK